jgi:AraC-like DNA-binding protein
MSHAGTNGLGESLEPLALLCLNSGAAPRLHKALDDYFSGRIRCVSHRQLTALAAKEDIAAVLYYLGDDHCCRHDAECLNAQFPLVPFIAVGHRLETSTTLWALRAGFWDFVALPQEFAHLCRRLMQACACRRDMHKQDSAASTVPMLLPHSEILTSTAAAIVHIRSKFSESPRVADLAALCGMSQVTFARRFKMEHGMTPTDYIKVYRLGIAKLLLRNTNLPIKEIAFSTGFSDCAYFARCFSRAERVSPSHYRRGRRRSAFAAESAGSRRDDESTSSDLLCQKDN